MGFTGPSADSPRRSEADTASLTAARLPGLSPPRLALFFSTYMLYICVNTVNGPLMPSMKSALNFTSGDGAAVAAVQTVGISAGKLLYGGWPVDSCGARRTYVATMLVASTLACTYSLARGPAAVGAIAFLLEFMSTPAYPCHVQLIRGWMPPETAGTGFSLLGLSSRTGDMASKLSYGQLLSVLDWQQVTNSPSLPLSLSLSPSLPPSLSLTYPS
jgi:sugar phosphate permease